MKSHPIQFLALLSLSGLTAISCVAPMPANAAPARLAFDFNSGPTWSAARAYALTPGVGTAASWQPVGTYNTAGTDKQSGAWKLVADATGAPKNWSAGLTSGALGIKNDETNLGKLTLAFTLSASANRPVKIKIASLDAAGGRTGGLETLVYPAAPDYLQRFALDLDKFQASGAGKFDPRAPLVQFAFEIDGAIWPGGKNELRVDDVNLSGPAFYVSPTGKDTSDGKTEATAFATPQKALDVAQPGDIILLMNGTYREELRPVASFQRPGKTAEWIVLKNYPGHKPMLSSNGWNIVNIAKGSKTAISEEPALAYLEVRGLHVRGDSQTVRTQYPDAIGQSDSRSNSNGIAAEGRYARETVHHIRMADNLVEYCPAQGLGALEVDWVQIENNISRFNCNTTIYATSGISTLGSNNFDTARNIYKLLIRGNVCYRNESYEIWASKGRLSDGNGIIIDVNRNSGYRPQNIYFGRTLVQSNLSYYNGGSGIHTVQADKVDIVGNTAYMNSASKGLQYSQIYTYGSDDVRIFNNILVAPVADVAAGEKPEPVNRLGGKNTNVVFKNNLYFGGNIAPSLGEGDSIADPGFVNPVIDSKFTDFRLKAGSPALGAGQNHPFAPFVDLNGKPRGEKPDLGAIQR